MVGKTDDMSPAHSDDGLTFQDAGDGSSPSAPAPKELEKDTTQIPSPSSTKTKSKGTGVAALMARFQSDPEVTPSINSTPSNTERSDGGQEATQILSSATATGGADLSQNSTEKSYDILTEAVQQVELQPTAMPASKGALSMLDPGETIKNPFGGDKTPVVDSGKFEQTQYESQSDDIVLKRYSAVPITKQEPEIVPDTPTTSQANRFSVVPLSTPAPTESNGNKDQVGIGGGAAASNNTDQSSAMDAQAEFLARHTARLSRADGDSRTSVDGAERIKERVRELRYGHSRESSMARRAGEGEYSSSSMPIAVREEEEEEQEDDVTFDVPLRSEGEAIDWDFWGNVMSNYQEIAQTQPQKLSQAIQAGIPGALRGMMWQLMSSSKDEEMEIIYAFYLKQTSSHEKMIRKDLSRTFPGQEYFKDGKGIGQENLFNVVKAYSLYDEECGYCQGMQFVVGPLLLNMPDEEAFSTLVRLMKSYDLRGHFIPNMPGLQLRLYQFDRLLEETLPLLHRHLVRSGVKSSMYASGWFMTLFSYRSPLDICFRILDSVFAEGIEALFRFAMTLMKKNEEDLLKMSFEEAVPLLAARAFDVYKSDVGQEGHEATESQDENSGGAAVSGGYRVNEFVRDAFEFRITAFVLDSYASDFAEQVRVANSHRLEVEQLKSHNRQLQAQVKDLESQLGAVQQEHVDLVKSVVMTKLAKEEMAEELVRYKLMYAEATLLADQSGVNRPPSSHLSHSSSSTSNFRTS